MRRLLIALAAAGLLAGIAGCLTAASSHPAPRDPVAGTWTVTYGNRVTVAITLKKGTYTETAKTPVEITGGSACRLRPGTVISSFRPASAPGTYQGKHGLWYQGTCKLAYWTSMSLVLSSGHRTQVLTARLGNGEKEIFTRPAP